MATYTKFEDTRQALVTLINSGFTTDGITDVTVTTHKPIGETSREDRVWVGNLRFRQEPLTFGANYAEYVDIDLVVACPTHGGSNEEQTTGEQRAETLFDSIMKSVRGDITVGSTVFNIELAEAESSDDVIDEFGPVGYIEATFEAEAHV